MNIGGLGNQTHQDKFNQEKDNIMSSSLKPLNKQTEKEKTEILNYNKEQYGIWKNEKESAKRYEVHFKTDDLFNILPVIIYANGVGEERESFYYCGYVGLPQGHSLFGTDYDEASGLSAHGGLTFSARHSLIPGYWFLGFDCAHGNDFTMESDKDDTYGKRKFHTKEDVLNDCLDLMIQISKYEEDFKKKAYIKSYQAKNKASTLIPKETVE